MHGIRLSGPPLGRRPKDAAIHCSKIKHWREGERIRNAVEGKSGEDKLAYDLDRTRTKLQETSETTISLVFLVMNLQKLQERGLLRALQKSLPGYLSYLEKFRRKLLTIEHYAAIESFKRT